MKQRTLIFGLVIAILMVIFALQNSLQVQVRLWFWEFDSSLALILLIALAVGAILGIIFSLPSGRTKKDKSEKKPWTPENDIENTEGF